MFELIDKPMMRVESRAEASDEVCSAEILEGVRGHENLRMSQRFFFSFQGQTLLPTSLPSRDGLLTSKALKRATRLDDTVFLSIEDITPKKFKKLPL